ncbi:hypothetical protein BAUCODRAFT_80619 [Baudoinia panamericana UAMH 10762]|uniref:Methyltransferase domain-containing protein n=1 Tax=Baudoinia panamericana (strain UAMH 10762) TaxID=717646 RepID=M2MIP7_BAUPA|nr:uncharacterized protein BAUCODRAFT_80619 [Baudoinia panamericana UAMH 10762]EMC91143.1 hypothetical protein BAUCODRAFT_80619 [Baudoinia panamericana UAMH 10762]
MADAPLNRSTDVTWYDQELGDLQPAALEVLQRYSNIPPDHVREHVHAIRDKAWAIWPYPCIGGFRFLDLNLPTMPQYPEILSRLHPPNNHTLLDLGCCFGQELRRLILDGAPATHLHGCDLRPEFLELGYDLFLDRATCPAHFFPADIFHPTTRALDALAGRINIVNASSLFHLFPRPDQLRLATRLVALLAPRPGSMVLGRQVANLTAGHYPDRTHDGGVVYRHNERSWQALWDEVGAATGTRWHAWSELWLPPRYKNTLCGEDGKRQSRFCVTRL